MQHSLLEVRDLTVNIHNKKNRKLPVIDNINFNINKREIVGIVGESGCGKSMTALSIMKLLPHNMRISETSTVTLDGKNLAELSSKEMRKIRGNDISMIFQEPMTSLNPVMKIGRQIKEIIQLHKKTSAQEAQDHTIRLLEMVGIPRAKDVYHEFPHQLSGGMRQRVMIAIAMACKPKLLIADEPTTALDVTIQAQILELMKQLKEEHHTAIMMITHDLGVVAEMCDRVIIMYAGNIVETADVKILFDNPNHPYTKGLIQSLPVHGKGKKRLYSISGNVPSISKRPKGCRFVTRCSFAQTICHQEVPALSSVGNHHESACWLNMTEKIDVGGERVYGRDS